MVSFMQAQIAISLVNPLWTVYQLCSWGEQVNKQQLIV